ncbi:hypothetical protein [Sphingomonas sp. BK069]|uniref:hypothetical protein n=1 Tax=Sphingomonas sp. BK069 TaxID=2586979 RepID=UPI00160A9912|nr:hypothetical protein [Sphingomonas sp. BK069]
MTQDLDKDRCQHPTRFREIGGSVLGVNLGRAVHRGVAENAADLLGRHAAAGHLGGDRVADRLRDHRGGQPERAPHGPPCNPSRQHSAGTILLPLAQHQPHGPDRRQHRVALLGPGPLRRVHVDRSAVPLRARIERQRGLGAAGGRGEQQQQAQGAAVVQPAGLREAEHCAELRQRHTDVARRAAQMRRHARHLGCIWDPTVAGSAIECRALVVQVALDRLTGHALAVDREGLASPRYMEAMLLHAPASEVVEGDWLQVRDRGARTEVVLHQEADERAQRRRDSAGLAGVLAVLLPVEQQLRHRLGILDRLKALGALGFHVRVDDRLGQLYAPLASAAIYDRSRLLGISGDLPDARGLPVAPLVEPEVADDVRAGLSGQFTSSWVSA